MTDYTVQYQFNSGNWNYLDVDASILRQQGNGVYALESYGADQKALSVGTVPAYRNIEGEPNWIPEMKLLKARVRLLDLLNTASLSSQVGDVRLRIHGYDAAGNFAPGTDDEIWLHVDAEPATGDIASILFRARPSSTTVH